MSNLYRIILNKGLLQNDTETVMEINFYDHRDGKNNQLMAVYSGYGNQAEGEIPHMHIFVDNLENHPNTGRNRRVQEACLRLDVPEYFNHNIKTSYILTTIEIKEVEAFLYEDYSGKEPEYQGLTN